MGRKRVTAEDVVRRLEGRTVELVEYAGSVLGRSTFRCLECGHVWTGTADNITRGRGCPKCAGSIPVTREEAERRLIGRNITLLEYGGTTTSMSTFRCNIDGHTWSTSFGSVDGGSGCQKCGYDRMALTIEDIRTKLLGRPIEIVEFGGRGYLPSKFRCTVPGCGHEWVTTTRTVCDEGCGCKKCAGLLKLTEDDIRARLQGRTVELVSYGGTTASPDTVFRCTIDGHEWSTTATSVISNGQGCAVCAGNIVMTEQRALEVLVGRDISLITYGGGSAQPSEFRCLKDGCGHTWNSTVHSVGVGGSGCPKCAGIVSPNLNDVLEMLHGRGIELLNYCGTSSGSSRFKCSTDGHEWETTVTNIRLGCGCPKCAGVLPIPESEIVHRLGDRPITLVEYGGTLMSQSLWCCDECGNEWRAPADRILGQGSGCPACADYGFNPSKPATFYTYKITTRHNRYLGFGITRNIDLRNAQHQKSFRDHGAIGELIFTHNGDGHAIWSVERTAIEQFEIPNTGIPGFIREATLFADWKVAVLKSLCSESEQLAISTQTE